MAPRGCSRRPARGDAQAEQHDEAGPTAQAGQAPQETEDLHRLNDEWHIAGTLRVLLPRRCGFLMLVLDRLMPFTRDAGFGHTIQLRDFAFDAALLSAFVEHWQLETHMFHLPWGEYTITL
ncbi:hypothetical protein PIB30_068108 [Stylosanthes scabra]|uniref:Aminotransferase-like plant mobile domain-containing protein n=1 Tax=Stylosanthes scabra TaxID=79078 RepID=A0ABU6ZLH7_9FABA|nr:hypothetical protein [Stylosanthes scabra]